MIQRPWWMLTQLRRIPRGDTIEEDHERDRALIANYIMDKTGAIRMFDRDGKTYVEVTDYPKMKQGVGMLLTELMRIKAEGDYAAIKALVDKYGVHFDPKLRDQVVQRYKVLDIPTYWVGVNAQLNAKPSNGDVGSVEMIYPRSAVHQVPLLRFYVCRGPQGSCTSAYRCQRSGRSTMPSAGADNRNSSLTAAA